MSGRHLIAETLPRHPVIPEQIRDGDVVIGSIRVSTSVRVECLFRFVNVDANMRQSMEFAMGILPVKEHMGDRRAAWEKILMDFLARFGEKLPEDAQAIFDSCVRAVLLEDDDTLQNHSIILTDAYSAQKTLCNAFCNLDLYHYDELSVLDLPGDSSHSANSPRPWQMN